MVMIRFRDVLKDRNFFCLWLGQVISNFGDRLNQMALVALVYQRNPGSALALAKLISFTIIPVFIIGPVAGAWVDRLDKRSVMIISDIMRGLLVLTIPFFIITHQILLIYFIVFLVFSISRFFIPSKMAIIPDLVSKDKLLVANTLSDTTHMIGNVVGLVIAGVIVNIPRVGAVGGFYMDAASFFISASLIALIAKKGLVAGVRDDLKISRQVLGVALRRSIVGEMREGFHHLTRYSDMRFVIASFFLLMAGLGAVSCVIIVFVQNAFGTATRDLGILGVCLVTGLFFGTIIFGRFCQKLPKRKAILTSFILTGIAVAAFALGIARHPHLLIGGIMSAAIGAAVSPIMIATNTLTHETIPDAVRGRIFSSLEAVIHLAFMAFMFLTAYLSKYIDSVWILVATGAVFAFGGIAGLLAGMRRATST